MNKKQKILAAAFGAVITLILLIGSALLTTGLVLGLLATASMVILFNRFAFLRKIAMKWPGMCDVGAAILTIALFGTTVTGLIAAAVVGLCTSFALDFHIASGENKFNERIRNFASALA